jgi:hypothetical protein
MPTEDQAVMASKNFNKNPDPSFLNSEKRSDIVLNLDDEAQLLTIIVAFIGVYEITPG